MRRIGLTADGVPMCQTVALQLQRAGGGIVKLDILRGIFAEFSTQSSVTGSVPILDDVENAVKSAGNICFKCLIGEIPADFNTSDIVINICPNSAKTTVAKNIKTGVITSAPARIHTGAVSP